MHARVTEFRRCRSVGCKMTVVSDECGRERACNHNTEGPLSFLDNEPIEGEEAAENDEVPNDEAAEDDVVYASIGDATGILNFDYADGNTTNMDIDDRSG